MSRIASNLGGVIDAMWGKMMLQVGCSGVQSLSNTLQAVYMFFFLQINCNSLFGELLSGNFCPGYASLCLIHFNPVFPK